jgi:hypothetical protein
MMTSLTAGLGIPACSIADSITMAPSWVAPIAFNDPLKLPSGVLTALTMTASFS